MSRDFPEYKETKPGIIIKKTLDLLFPPDQGFVYEVRIPKTKYGTISGYFDDNAVAAGSIARENGKHQAIYITANPVDPALVARNHNKFEFGSQTTTNDAEIIRRRWFLVDLDPVRPAGISSSQHELDLAIERANSIRDWLVSLGWPEPVEAISGNGAHLMFRVDEPNDDPTRADFEFATKMLAGIFSDDKISVDTTMWNASRVWKIYGTVAAKGSGSDERPHRVAMLTRVPKDIQVTPRGLIENLANALKNANAEEFKDMTGEFIEDMEKWLFDRGQTVTSGPRPLYGAEGKKWMIAHCPFNPQHVNPMVGLVNNRPVYRCLHDSCAAFRWKEFREKIDPNFKDPETIYTRLKAWCEGSSELIDNELLESACRTGKKLDGLIKRLRKECPRARVNMMEDALRRKRREFYKETMGENNEKGNIVGVINKTRAMQEEGVVPMYWMCEYDHRVRVGTIGDVDAEKVSESDEIALMIKFHSMGESWVKQIHCSQVIRHLSMEYKVNPIRAHLKQYRWDGVKRLDNWLIHYMGVADNEYTRAVGRKWLISVVARGMNPGCQADHMLILEGKQGIGKSQGLRALGGPFYTEFSRSMTGGGTNHKDMVAVINGKLIVEMSEMATIKKADMESLKAILTTTVDDVRLSYERDPKSYPRTCAFAGTTNDVGQPYIADISGVRRFWPVVAGETGPMKITLLKEDRDQLWAEAVDAYEEGEDWWTIPAALAAEEQESRQLTVEATDPWYAKVRQALTDPDSYINECFYARDEFDKGAPTGHITIRAGQLHQILGMVVGVDIERQTTMDANRIRNIFRTLGFKKVRPSIKWFDSTYAYDLSRDHVPHIWPGIEAAVKAAKQKSFSREEQID